MILSADSTPSPRQFIDKVYDVEVEKDVAYAVGGIRFNNGSGDRAYRPLKLDIYRPRCDKHLPRPALVLAFGGAFHRGSKGVEVFEGEVPSTAMAEYCQEFAKRGYICFSIDYRLMTEDPDPGFTPVMPPNLPLQGGRIDYVRGLLGLPPCTPKMIENTLEAATDDMSSVVAFVRSSASALGVDPSRIAIGGFSAGAVIALMSAYAEHAPVKAVISISGRVAIPVLKSHAPIGMPPPALLIHGEHDLPEIFDAQAPMRNFMNKIGIETQSCSVPGAGHFYLRTASVAGGIGRDVETCIAEFLHQSLGLGGRGESAITVAQLQAFADAWNRHDIDALMSFMTDDCVFHANAGSEIHGTTYRGSADVREGYMKAWQTFPDAQWNNARHAVSGNRGFSEWVFTGTDQNGQKVELAGCDIFEFRGGKIAVKDSFRKRPA